VGAVLIGAVLPKIPAQTPVSDGRSYRGSIWTAWLGIDGRPRTVAQNLLDDARAAGFRGLPAEPSCSPDGCTAYTFDSILEPGARPRGRSFGVEIWRTDPNGGFFGAVTVIDWGGLDVDIADPHTPSNFAHPETDPPAVTRPARGRVPASGQRLRFLGRFSVTVEPGTTAIAPVVSPMRTAEAIVRVTANGQRAHRSYVHQLHRVFPRGSETSQRAHTLGWTIASTHVENGAGGGTVDLLTRGSLQYIRLTLARDQ
jgi:hypothetical protein